MAACLLAWDTFELLNRWTVLVLPSQPLFGKRLVIYFLQKAQPISVTLGYTCVCVLREERPDGKRSTQGPPIVSTLTSELD